MAKLLETEELKSNLCFEYSKNTVLTTSKMTRKHNILAFNSLLRDGLRYGEKERRVCFYDTLKGEKIYIQYPGKESVGRSIIMPLDFRPKLQMNNGKFISDISFGDIWDILDEIGKEHKKCLSYIATIFLRLGYMYDYSRIQGTYEYQDIDICNSSSESGSLNFDWYALNLSEDIWHTLNDKIGNIHISDKETFSFEAFIKLVDLLFQNEDCKYYYKNVVINNKKNYKLTNGRTNSCEANLLIINHLEEYTKLSELLNAFQKSRGVPKFKKQDYALVTDGIVTNIDME